MMGDFDWPLSRRRPGCRAGVLSLTSFNIRRTRSPRALAPATGTGPASTLATALAGTKGYSAPDVGETIAKVRAPAQQIDRPEYLVPLLTRQFLFHQARSGHKLALSMARAHRKNRQGAERCRREIAGSLYKRGDLPMDRGVRYRPSWPRR
jgi:hypothetical protein